MAVDSKHAETIALHAGWRADQTNGAVAVPIYQTTSYQFRDTEHAANLFALQDRPHLYAHRQPDDRRLGGAARGAGGRRGGPGARFGTGGVGALDS